MNVKEAIDKRRAYRSLDSITISKELIQDLAGSARLSASCSNKQPWRYIFVYGSEELTGLHPALNKGNEWIHLASMIVAVCSRKDLDCIVKNREYYLFDTGMATAFLIMRATELGLVAHPIGGFDEDKVKEALGVPADMTVITLVIVGKHTEKINPVLSEQQIAWEKIRPERMEISDFAFLNQYGNSIG
jgi:nitroreductase